MSAPATATAWPRPLPAHAEHDHTPVRNLSPGWVQAVGGLAVTATWAAAVWTSVHVEADPMLHRTALFVHLASLLFGFGFVLALDWAALQWLVGRLTLEQLSATISALQAPIWGGLLGLVTSGVLLGADPTRPLTALKLGLVLVVGLNGINASSIHRHLSASGATLPRRLLVRSVIAAGVSQAGWWGAVLIGFVNRGT